MFTLFATLRRFTWPQAALALALAWTSGLAAAQYPERPIRIVVPSPAGDGSDVLARALSKAMGEAMGQSFVIDNKPGAGGSIGAQQVARAASDGYTLFLANASSHGVTPGLYPSLPYDSVADFAPVGLIATAPNLLVVRSDAGIASYADYVRQARQQPGKLSIASAGSGSLSHLSAELLRSSAGLDLLHVPYKGAAPALTDIMGGQVASIIINIPSVLPHIANGRMTPLAVTSAKRAAALPNVPTLMESGVRGYDTVAWFGLLAPARTPPELLQKLHTQLQAALRQPEVRDTLTRLGAESSGAGPREFGEFMRSEMAKYDAVIKSASIKIN
ncbi:tripartite tricarboxylate transporter substrate binding protein [Hydrogenophaga sp. BPS33]|uniref:tripartite tricarboxylate transporter substrate binding protein n=1 Tax=Hydrogenophaga sp. BPS33 TaxID=2651974 RepID=UPI00131F990A|nr:tripartite tricarboxylate transporter substrate binding protein [Hydrogenophaga sp. BPS33]QHE87389.1 tripartite tricarboxylate transporter substrate binding protein [Hydrogenophaga sp. BPS33]